MRYKWKHQHKTDNLQTRTDHVYTHIRTCLEVFETLKCYLELKGIKKRRRVIQDCNVRDLYFSHTAMLHHFTLGGKFRVKSFFTALRMLRFHYVNYVIHKSFRVQYIHVGTQ